MRVLWCGAARARVLLLEGVGGMEMHAWARRQVSGTSGISKHELQRLVSRAMYAASGLSWCPAS